MLDPSIILGVKPLEQTDPAKQYFAMAELQGARQNQQARALEIAAATHQQQQSAALDKALSQATVIDPATGKVNTDRAAAVQSLREGGFGQAALGLQQGWQKQDLEQSKALLENQKLMLGNQQAHVEAVGGIANSILALPPEQQPQAYAVARQHMIQQGIVSPDELPEQYNPQVVQAAQAQSMKASELLTAQHQKVEADQKSVQLAQEAQRNADTALYQQGELKARAQSDATARRGQNMTDARERQRLSIEAGHLQLDRQKQQIDIDGGVEAQAQQIAKGELPLPPQGRNNPRNKALTDRALQLNPQLSTNLYNTVQDYYSSKGKTNQQITTLNKLADHLQELRGDSSRAGFSPFGFTAAGKDLRLGQQLFSNEDVKFLSGSGVAHEGELTTLRKNIFSPIQSVRDSAIDTLSKYTADAARQVANQFTRDTRMPFDSGRAFTDNTRKLLGTAPDAPAQGAPLKATHRYNPSTGKIEAF